MDADVPPKTPAARESARTWVQAAGPPLVLVLVLQGAFAVTAVRHQGAVEGWRVALTVLLFVCDGIGRRLVNDFEDHRRGVDRPDRVRPDSSMALGLDMNRVRWAGMGGFAAAWVCLLVLALTSEPLLLLVIPPMYAAYFAYAGGRRPLGHRGFGELLDFVVTGTAVTLVIGRLNGDAFDAALWCAALACGFLFMTLMLHNNARDLAKDREAGKVTLPHLIPSAAVKALYVTGLAGCYGFLALTALSLGAWGPLLPLVTLPWAALLAVRVCRGPLGTRMIDWSGLYLLMLAVFATFTAGGWLPAW
ncbi:prenyltransferase [Streptomyces marincola]|uniref:prenyltransferase n=1 Tax=Streptomyces marincola TaxID=2878388 RepID=UPI00131BD10F|nr:prenyltransferase [Streptomyces marincola]